MNNSKFLSFCWEDNWNELSPRKKKKKKKKSVESTNFISYVSSNKTTQKFCFQQRKKKQL